MNLITFRSHRSEPGQAQPTVNTKRYTIGTCTQDKPDVKYLQQLSQQMPFDFVTLTPKTHWIEVGKQGVVFKNLANKPVHLDAILSGGCPYNFLQPWLKTMELNNKPTLNTINSIDQAADKLQTHLLLSQHDIPMPKTWFIHSITTLRQVMQTNPEVKWVLKETNGSKGQGVFAVETIGEAVAIAEKFWQHKKKVILQECIPECHGQSLRVLILNGKVQTAYLRQSDQDFRSNADQHTTTRPVAPNGPQWDKAKALALKSAALLGLNSAGVDLLMSNRGPLVLEVNSSPGFFLPPFNGVDVYRERIGYLLDRLNKSPKKTD